MASPLDAFRQHCQPLYGFVYKYFDKMTPESMVSYEFILSPTEIYQLVCQAWEQVPSLNKQVREEDDVVDVWAHKELLLKTLVVLTNLPMMYELLYLNKQLDEAVKLRDALLDDFTQKIIEDPNVVHALQAGTIDEELQQRRSQLFNFKPLFEQRRSLVVNPLGIDFKEIPEKF
jgi:hypothetical protein